jgi:hypothetical protein
VLYEAQLSRYRGSLDEPLVGREDNRAQVNELDQLASEAPETGQLSEPLADSILQYTLRRLKLNASSSQDRPGGGSKTLYPDDLDRLMNEAPPSSSGSQRTGEPAATRFEGNSALRNVNLTSNAFTMGTSGVPTYGDWTNSPPMAMDQNSSLDWWHFGLDNSIQEPTGLYDDVFNFNNQIG